MGILVYLSCSVTCTFLVEPAFWSTISMPIPLTISFFIRLIYLGSSPHPSDKNSRKFCHVSVPFLSPCPTYGLNNCKHCWIMHYQYLWIMSIQASDHYCILSGISKILLFLSKGAVGFRIGYSNTIWLIKTCGKIAFVFCSNFDNRINNIRPIFRFLFHCWF